MLPAIASWRSQCDILRRLAFSIADGVPASAAVGQASSLMAATSSRSGAACSSNTACSSTGRQNATLSAAGRKPSNNNKTAAAVGSGSPAADRIKRTVAGGAVCLRKDAAAVQQRARALSLLQRYYNVAVPGLKGAAVLARVVREPGPRRPALVDPGYYGLSPLPAEALTGPDAVPYSPDGTPLLGRAGLAASADNSSSANTDSSAAAAAAAERRLRRGDLARVRFSAAFTPYGDVQVDAWRARGAGREKRVWDELGECMRSGVPVWGRVLNQCGGGYAVGVAGFVALLPSNQAHAAAVGNIGALQRFYVHRMNARRRFIELSSAAPLASWGGFFRRTGRSDRGTGGTGGGGGGGGGAGGGGSDGQGSGTDASLWSNL